MIAPTSLTTTAAALAGVRPVAPRTPMKDYGDVWLPLTLGTLAVIALLLSLLWWGWRGRRRRQAGVPAPAPVPAEVLEREPAERRERDNGAGGEDAMVPWCGTCIRMGT